MDRFTYLLMRALWWGLGLFPLRLVVALARSAGVIGWWLAPAYRRLVMRNITIAFGDTIKHSEKCRIGRQHFANLAANIAAGACLTHVPVSKLKQCVSMEGLDHLEAARARGRGIVALLGHLGNWELLARLSPDVFQMPCGSVYQRLSNSHLDAWVRRARATEGLELFERKEGFHGAINLLRRGGIVGVLADQHAGDRGLWCPLFNRLASTSPLVATMAIRTGSSVMGIALYTQPKGRWRLVIRPEVLPDSRDTAELTARLNVELEKMIREAPADWLWAHNRWKTPFPRFLAIGTKRGVSVSLGLQRFRLLVRSVNWLGDAVMSVPAVRAIKHSRPDLELTVACQEKLAGFWRSIPEVDRVLSLSKNEGILAAAARFKAESFDAVVVFPNSLRTGLEAWLAGIPRRVGYPGHHRAFLLNQVMNRPRNALSFVREPRHQVHDYLELSNFMGAPPVPKEEWTGPHTPPPGAGTTRPWKIAVCPGAEFGAAKRWFPERFAEVMRRVSADKKSEWLLVGVAKDAPVGEAIESAASGLAVRNLIGSTSLEELINTLRGCDALLTNDTGTMHLASLFGVPLVAVFGSTEPLLTGPLGPRSLIAQHRVPCGPCFQRVCPLDFACMKGVEAAEVSELLASLLRQG